MLKSEVIYKGRHYTACAMRVGALCMSRNYGSPLGVRLLGSTSKLWEEAIRTAEDPKEVHMLCRALMSSVT